MRYVLVPFFLMTMVSGASAQNNPAGIRGVDWERRDIVLEISPRLIVTATVLTKDVVNGNRSSVTLFIDGRQVSFKEEARAFTTTTAVIDSKGSHTIIAQCGNKNATADTCSISIERVASDTF